MHNATAGRSRPRTPQRFTLHYTTCLITPPTPRGRRATFMRDRRRGMGTMRTRIRRAWRALRGWLGEERVRIRDVVQKHAHAQAVRQSEDVQQAEEEDSRIVVLRTREGSSRPTSRAGLRRSRHFPEVKPLEILCLFPTRCVVKAA
jgi:hypothetical protein